MTFQNAFWGFVIGCGAGILTGMVSSRFVSFSKALLPVAIAHQRHPDPGARADLQQLVRHAQPGVSKIAIVAVSTYFPVDDQHRARLDFGRYALAGVDEDPTRRASGKSSASCACPSALPFIFSALKVGTTLAMIAAIVSEYFGGSTAGLGYRIRDDAGLFKYPEAWSAIFVAALYGIIFYHGGFCRGTVADVVAHLVPREMRKAVLVMSY